MEHQHQSLSKTHIDRLGERLRTGRVGESELVLLHQFRRSFSPAYDHVFALLRNELGLQPTGRPAKSTGSIREKLKRETIRLSQMQDIAGCRIVVDSLRDQDALTIQALKRFGDITVIDRRESPSHGYRAVHAIVNSAGKAVEIQIRTAVQHAWAELSEKLADVFDPTIKYGGGSAELRKLLDLASQSVRLCEEHEAAVHRWRSASEGIREIGDELRALVAECDAEGSEESLRASEHSKRQLAEIEADQMADQKKLAESEASREENKRRTLQLINWIAKKEGL